MDIEKLRQLCLELPFSTEDLKWGHDICFCIGEKMYCVTSADIPMSVSLKVSDEDFEALTEREGIVPAPYLARHKWVLVQGPQYLSETEWEHLVKQSYQLVKAKLPKKTRQQLGGE
ncbi:MAG: MmcQ/YjbR family DNA-binding protein [Chitinophagales bacterium]|nr:MmcQ/YjbR family DNA-binding protein [Chitinophagales bacterium]